MNTDVNALTERVLGCAFSVSNTLGAGFLEGVYERALAIELESNSISFSRQSPLKVLYRDREVGIYVADFIVENRLILEIKAVSKLLGEHQAQLLNYLKAGNFEVGLLINFGRPRLEIKRMAL